MPNNSNSFEIETFPFAAVLWDMDGTLIDSEPIWINQERELMNSLGVAWSDADAIHCIGGPMTRVDAYMRSKLSAQQQVEFPAMRLTELLLQRMEIELPKGVAFAAGAQELLKDLKGYNLPMALVSASSRALVNAALGFIGSDYFQVTISNDEVIESKPNPEGYLKAAKALGVNIADCLILEDSITGVRAAIDSGAYVIGIPHVTDLPTGDKVAHVKSLQDLDLDSLSGLFELVRG